MASWSWTLFSVIAWSLGLKAVYDLRSEHSPCARTWCLLAWALWFRLSMEIAMAAAAIAPALWLLSVTTGSVSAVLMAGGIGSWVRDLRRGEEAVCAPWLDLASAGMFAGLVAITAAWIVIQPSVALAAANALQPLEGAAWILASGALVPLLLRSRYEPWQRRVFRPQQLALAFIFSFLSAILTPVAWLLGVRFPPEIGPLLSTLFVLTLVTALAATVIRLRGHKLATVVAQAHEYEQQLLITEKVAAVGTLAAGAAHDFNNTLTIIAGYAELALDDGSLPKRTRSDFEQIRAAARSAGSIADSLLGVVRRSTSDSSPRDIRDAVTMPLAMLDREFMRRHIKVVTAIEPGLPSPAIDLIVLSQVCFNLYLNARDAMVPTGGGRLTVSVAARGDSLTIGVQDTGTGIPREFRSRMFEPLQTTKGERGTGLGLSVSKRMISSAGGHLTFETEEGRGTLFLIELPAASPDAAGAAILRHPDWKTAAV